MTAETVLDILERERHCGEGWHFFRELRMGVGNAKQSEFRLDGWAMTTWEARGLERVTYEVKVERSDWRRELKTPVKRRMGLMLSHRFYFVAPPGLIRVEEVPPECGLIEILPEALPLSDAIHATTREWLHLERVTKGQTLWRCRTVVGAPKRDSLPFTWTFAAMLIRRIADAGELGRLGRLNAELQERVNAFEVDQASARAEAQEARRALAALQVEPELLESDDHLAGFLAGWVSLQQMPEISTLAQRGYDYEANRALTDAQSILAHALPRKKPSKTPHYARRLLLDLAARAYHAGRQAALNEGQLAQNLEAGLS